MKKILLLVAVAAMAAGCTTVTTYGPDGQPRAEIRRPPFADNYVWYEGEIDGGFVIESRTKSDAAGISAADRMIQNMMMQAFQAWIASQAGGAGPPAPLE